jgi:hypothetical protein
MPDVFEEFLPYHESSLDGGEKIPEVLMKVWIDRDTCDSNLAACLSCFGQMVLTGVPDRGCIVKYEDDGSETLTVFMRSDGQEREPLIIPKEMRDMVAYEG